MEGPNPLWSTAGLFASRCIAYVPAQKGPVRRAVAERSGPILSRKIAKFVQKTRLCPALDRICRASR